MITIRRHDERGHANHGWLDTWHTFSFARYYDPQHMGFRALRVINEDFVAPGAGFPTHPHDNMEIITYVLEGELRHEDSMGTGSVIRPGEIQRMTAGTGVTHSEFNASDTARLHLLQIWLLPERRGLEPSYEQKQIPPREIEGSLRLIASRDGRDDSVIVHQDVDLYAARLGPDDRLQHALRPGRHAWLQVARGTVGLGDSILEAGSGAAISDQSGLELTAAAPAEVLLFDLS